MSNQSSSTTNKALVLKFLEAFSDSRFDAALELMDDAGSWWVAGSTRHL